MYNCIFSGSNSKYYPCNTQTCVYPAQRTCCIPYVPMIIGGKSICGPLPKEAEVTSCCPIGGIWSEWSVFSRNEKNFVRTRKCLTADAGCDCTGLDFDTLGGCPCKSFPPTNGTDINRVLRTHKENGSIQRLVPVKNGLLDPITCIYTAEIDTSDTNKDHKDQCNKWKGYVRTAAMRYITPHNTGEAFEERVADCTVAKTTYFQIGDTSRYLPCNTQTCVYPAQRTCCIPYVPMIVSGKSICGPLPRDTSSTTTSCCPKNGLWSDWSGFGSVSDGWMQTRECLSESAGCPCTGSSSNTQSTCPCPAMQTDQQVATACAGTLLWQKNNVTTDDLKSTRTATLIASNNVVVACHPYGTYQYAPYVFFSTPTNTCPFDRPWNCEARKEPGGNDATLDITFTCNLERLQWMYDYDGSFVNGYVQILYDS
ncbi:hypothetical protein CAEBREN_22759 [Caenorhabditis brenneri]|uniref:Uncharacterized protein n=1 Tax=Caenorhabditis brenneri TaxID=135651 RepID=G0NA00_CAEBE|nr:hypothetical protein CAEBREN_22759 [Caenorhabditis brenneri]